MLENVCFSQTIPLGFFSFQDTQNTLNFLVVFYHTFSFFYISMHFQIKLGESHTHKTIVNLFLKFLSSDLLNFFSFCAYNIQ